MTNLREKKKHERKQRIFSAAFKLIEEKGFDETSMTDIAARAELAVGTLYNYFPSKNDLILAIFDRDHQKFIVKVKKNIEIIKNSEDNGLTILKNILLEFISDFIFLNKKTMRQVLVAFFSSEEHLQEGIRMDLQIIELLKQILDILKKDNKIAMDIQTDLIAETIYGLVFEQIIMYSMIPEIRKQTLQNNLQKQIEILYQGIQPK